MYAYIHTYAHTHAPAPAHPRAPACTPTHTHACPCAHACTRMHPCTRLHTHTHAPTRSHAHTRSRTMHTHHTHAQRMRDKPTRSRIPLKRIRLACNAFFTCSAWQCSTTRRKRLKTALIASNHAQTCSHLPETDTHRRASVILHCTINDKPRTGRG